FGFALKTAAANMQRASRMLMMGQLAAPAQNLERVALTRLEQILMALRSDEDSSSQNSAPEGQTPGSRRRSGDEVAANTAELKLLKLLQVSIKQRTVELEADRSKKGVITSEQQQELNVLADEQGRLADMVLGLIRVNNGRLEDVDALPDPEQPRTQSPK